MRRRRKAIGLTAGSQLKSVQELASVLRSLHRLLLDYAPPWYTSNIDDRLREALANADSQS